MASTWSGYYYTLFAVGGALLVGLWLSRLDRWGLVALSAALLWWHAAGAASRAFAVVDGPWVWSSHLTASYFQRAAALTDTLAKSLTRTEPSPPQNARFFFATLPSWAGFQMGNGALIRSLYRDRSIESHFYSQFSDTTAGDHPCRFFYWDGAAMLPLYGASSDPFFQVGTDLLLLDRPDGAAHAFRRGLASGGNPQDHLYWLGWAELWGGHRAAAEDAWSRLGAKDDSLPRERGLRATRDALAAGDSLAARRALLAAIHHGIGYPEAHAVLGQLLVARQPKYGMLELKVAAALGPGDWPSRRDLVVALIEARLDEPARRVLRELERIDPGYDYDPELQRARRTLSDRSPTGTAVFQF